MDDTACPTTKLLQAVLDGSSEGCLIVADEPSGTIVHANQAAQKLLSLDAAASTIARSIDDLLDFGETTKWADLLRTQAAATEGESNTVTSTAVLKDNGNATPGPPLTVQCTRLGTFPGHADETSYLCVRLLVDSDKKHQQHEEELLYRESLMQGMINASFDPMFEIDATGTIRVVNDAATHLFGYSRQEFIGSNISMICGGGHAQHHDGYMKRYLETGQKRIIGRKRQVQARRKDGSEFDMELGVQEIVVEGGQHAFCGYVRDLTQQKKDKRALRKQAELVHGKFFQGSNGEDATAGDVAGEKESM